MLLGDWLRLSRGWSPRRLSQRGGASAPRRRRRDHGSDRASEREENQFYGERRRRTDRRGDRREKFKTDFAGTGRKSQCDCPARCRYQTGCGTMRSWRLVTRMSQRPEPLPIRDCACTYMNSLLIHDSSSSSSPRAAKYACPPNESSSTPQSSSPFPPPSRPPSNITILPTGPVPSW